MTAREYFGQAVQGVFDRANTLAGGGKLSVFAFGELLDLLKTTAVKAAKDLALAGYQKKELVMSEIANFIDKFLPLPAYLFFLRGPIKRWLLALADGAIEALYRELVKPVPPLTPAA